MQKPGRQRASLSGPPPDTGELFAFSGGYAGIGGHPSPAFSETNTLNPDFSSFVIAQADPPLAVSAPSYVVMDAQTGTIPARQNASESYHPASMAKVMTLHLSLRDSEKGRLPPDPASRPFAVPAPGTWEEAPPGSSLLGFQNGDAATLMTLRRAVAIVSANEAARALAAHPDALTSIHSLPAMEYQPADQMALFRFKRNTNLLLDRVEGVDGLKTGALPESGFHFLATARRGRTRLLVLVMGIREATHRQSLITRARDGTALLEWGFENFRSTPLTTDSPGTAFQVPVRHGESFTITPSLQAPDSVLTRMILLPKSLEAPIRAGDEVGHVVWYLDGRPVFSLPLQASGDIRHQWRLRHLL